MTDAITIQNPRNRGGSTGHVLAKRSVTFTEIRNKTTTFLIETHSEHLILRILRRIRETSERELPEGLQPVSPADVSIVYMEPDAAGVRTQRIEIDRTGEFTSRWPNGFFAERSEELF